MPLVTLTDGITAFGFPTKTGVVFSDVKIERDE
jgi:hypothetical protein